MRKVLTYILLFGVFFTSIFAQTEIPKAQAMFIYNFSRLIEWPDNYKNGPFVIGVLGTSSTLKELQMYAEGKSVGSQPIVIKKFETPEEITTCHILFVPFAKTKQLSSILPKIQHKSTLIITEKAGGTDEGAAINFIIANDKLKFEVKPANATRYNIKLSSKLSEMAAKIY